MAGYPVETCRGCRSTERASMMYSLMEEDTRKLFSDCTRMQLPRTDDGESLGQLCAPCYEYCEGWFAFKSMCWNNNTSNVIDLEEEDSLATNGLHEEITIQSEDYDTNGFETLSNSGPLELDDDHRIENMDTAWECPCDCEVTGKSYETFRDHLRDNHLNGNCNKCPICNIRFSTSVLLYSHVYGVHMGKLDCSHCQKRMPSFTALKRHIEFNHSDDNFKEPLDWTCPICNTTLCDYYEFRGHMTMDHFPGHVSKCPLCSGIHHPKTVLIEHIMHSHMEVTDCRLCGKRCCRYMELRKHFKNCPQRYADPQNLPPRPPKAPRVSAQAARSDMAVDWECPCDCEVTGKSYAMFKDHFKDKHLNGNLQTCPLCNITFSTSVLLYGHVFGVHMGKLNCSHCQKIMPTFPALRAHIEHSHTDADDDFKEPIDWTCPVCKESIDDYYEFRGHFVTAHVPGQDNHCPVCDEEFFTKEKLLLHVLQYHMRATDCSLCGKRCYKYMDLRRHFKTCPERLSEPQAQFMLPRPSNSRQSTSRKSVSEAEPEKPESAPGNWDCPVCEEPFAEYLNLRIHLKQNHLSKTTNSQDSCPLCEKSFNKRGNFYNHIVHKHMKAGNRPKRGNNWNCPVCESKFTDYTSVRIHLKENHIIVGPDEMHNCPLCEASYVTSGRINAHIVKKHLKKWDCPRCMNTLESFAAYQMHKHLCDKENPTEDDDDDDDDDEGTEETEEMSTGEFEKEEVEEEEHSDSESFQPQEKKIKLEPGTMESHRVNWDCVVCGVACGSYVEFRTHLNEQHMADNSQNLHRCPICAKEIRRVDNYTVHVIREHMRKFRCPVCEARLISFKDVNHHMLTVHGGGGYDSTLNVFTAPTSGSFPPPPSTPHKKVSEAVHAAVLAHWGRWDCVICHEEFTRSRDLRIHTNACHIDKKTNECPICRAEFGHISNVHRHIMKVHMKKLNCYLCSFKGEAIFKLVKHMALDHSISLEFDSSSDY